MLMLRRFVADVGIIPKWCVEKIRSELVTDMSYKAVVSWHAVNNTTMSYEVVLS